MQDALESALNDLRPGFDADGFDVTIDSIGADGVVVVRIGHRPDCCEECLIPDDMLAPMLKAAMQQVAPGVIGVELKHEHLA